MRRSDIATYPFPENQTVLTALARLAIIAEEAIDQLYTQRADSLHQLHTTAERLYTTLRAWSTEYAIAAKHDQSTPLAAVASLLLHSGRIPFFLP